MKSGLAQIPVQNSFCQRCSHTIKSELLKVNDISNVYLYPKDSLVVFNFVKANELSDALNILMSLGYPPKGDKVDKKNCRPPLCCCQDKHGAKAA